MASGRSEDTRRKAADGDRTSGLKGFWVQSFVGIALVLLLVVGLLLYLWVARERASDRLDLEKATDALAEQVTAAMTRIRSQVDTWRTDPNLRAAFRKSGNPEALHQEGQALLRTLPGALSIHLFAPEQTSSVEGIPFMSYAGLDLARKAAQDRAATLIEVHKVGQPDMHLAMAIPVLDESGERTVGVVHGALPMTLLPSALKAATGHGLVLYQQVVGDTAANLGGAAAPTRPPDHSAPIGGTRLRVAAWLDSSDGLDPWLLGVVGALYLVLLGSIAGVLMLGYAAQRRALLLDCKGFTILIEDAVHRRPLRRIRSRISEVQDAHQETLTLLRGLQPTRAPLRGSVAPQVPIEAQESASASTALDDSPSPTSALSASSIEVAEIDLPEGLDPYSEPLEEAIAAAIATPVQDPLEALAAGLESYGNPLADIPAEVFRANDIRGLVEGQLTLEAMHAIGQAIGSEALEHGDRELMIGHDCRTTSPALAAALVAGIRSAGPNVTDLGLVPTPLVYFACCQPTVSSGAMVTASHNPSDYNGVKVIFHGLSAQSDEIQGLRQRILVGAVATGRGRYQTADIIASYRDFVERDVALARRLKVVIDCGNATASTVAPALYRALGCDVIELNCDLEAGLPAHLADPAAPECTRDLGDLVVNQEADLGLAFDSDGDRLGVVDSQGRFIAADRVLMLLAADVLSRHPGTDVIFDVKCSRHLADEIRQTGGRPIMWRCGHAPLKAKLRESTALIGGELSGHFVYKERWFGFDDAIYAGARLLEVLSQDPRSSSEVFGALPGGLATPELALPLAEGEPTRIMRAVMQLASRLEGVDVIRIDGLRAEFDRGFGVVRASNTEPKLTFRFEGDDAEALEKIQALFRRLMEKAARGLTMPF